MMNDELDQTSGDGRVPRSWVRTVYPYLVSLIGLILVTIGGIRLIDLGLKVFVFTQAEQEERLGYMQPPVPYALDHAERVAADSTAQLTAQERQAVRQWLEEYRRLEEQRDRVDPVIPRRQRTASSSLAMLIVGIPLYLYHWAMVRRDARAGRLA
jgi:hypothetical protein